MKRRSSLRASSDVCAAESSLVRGYQDSSMSIYAQYVSRLVRFTTTHVWHVLVNSSGPAIVKEDVCVEQAGWPKAACCDDPNGCAWQLEIRGSIDAERSVRLAIVSEWQSATVASNVDRRRSSVWPQKLSRGRCGLPLAAANARAADGQEVPAPKSDPHRTTRRAGPLNTNRLGPDMCADGREVGGATARCSRKGMGWRRW